MIVKVLVKEILAQFFSVFDIYPVTINISLEYHLSELNEFVCDEYGNTFLFQI